MTSNVSAAPGETEPGATHIPYLPGLDGLRAFAVAAVMLYHAGYNVAGGYLGVESFLSSVDFSSRRFYSPSTETTGRSI